MYQSEEDKKTLQKMQKNNEKLQAFVKTYKRQAEENDELASANFLKFRQAKKELENAAENAENAENLSIKIRAKTRSSISCNRSDSDQVI